MFPGLTGESRNETLIELLCGILLYGAAGQAVLFLFKDSVAFLSIGWWIGIITALFCGYHMWWVLDRALDFGEKEAVKKVTSSAVIRYLVILAVLAVITATGIGNPVAAVFGVLGLKIGAYMQPFIERICKGRR